jgi:hypothetical protein
MMEATMRIAFAMFVLLAATTTFDGARADPYRWCAHYSGDGGNGTNCYFTSLEQCRWAVSGVGGSCGLNPFYTGPDRTTSPQRGRSRY